MSIVDPIILPSAWSVGDLLDQLGGLSPERIPAGFSVGGATEKDLLNLLDHSNRICELVDGVLVEKTMGMRESILALFVAYLIQQYLENNALGIVSGPDGPMRILPRQVRFPDVAFISFDRLPGRKVPQDAIFDGAPNLAIEILSPSNTRKEMARKLNNYFTAGVQLVWYIDPDTRTAQAFDAEDRPTDYSAADETPGGDVLPGFKLPLAKVFAKLDAAG